MELLPMQRDFIPDLVSSSDAINTAEAPHVKIVRFTFIPRICWSCFEVATRSTSYASLAL